MTPIRNVFTTTQSPREHLLPFRELQQQVFFIYFLCYLLFNCLAYSMLALGDRQKIFASFQIFSNSLDVPTELGLLIFMVTSQTVKKPA